MVDGPQVTTMAPSIRAKYLMPKGGSERPRTTFSNHLGSLPSFSGAESAKLKDVMECIQVKGPFLSLSPPLTNPRPLPEKFRMRRWIAAGASPSQIVPASDFAGWEPMIVD